MKETFYTTNEMIEGIKNVTLFNPRDAYNLAQMIGNFPIWIIAIGSSLLFPGTHAKKRAMKMIPERRIEFDCPNNFTAEAIPKNSFVILISNSGKTTEILKMAQGLKKEHIPFYGITAQSDSNLAEICGDNLYVLSGKFEKGVAATKSVVEQALFLDALIHGLAGCKVPFGFNQVAIQRAMRESFDDYHVREELKKNILKAQTLYFIDHNSGVAKELKLKATEILGKRAIYESATTILHGPGEAIEEDDMIFVIGSENYSDKDVLALNKLCEKTKCKFIAISATEKRFERIHAPVAAGYEAYSYLVSGWNVFRKMAEYMGRDIDHPSVAEKYRS